MARYKRKDNSSYYITVSVNLPVDCLIAIDRYKKNNAGNNRSLALEYIIRDWKRIMDQERELKQE